MSQVDRAEMVERVRKLLAKVGGKSGCTQEESQAAFTKASRYIMEHNLTLEDIEGKPCERERDPDVWVEEEVYVTGRWSMENALCSRILSRFFFVHGLYQRRASSRCFGNQNTVYSLFGKAENVAVARHIWTALHHAFDHHWKTYKIRNNRPTTERRLFVEGMARGFSEKLSSERAAEASQRDRVTGKQGGTVLALTSIEQRTRAKLDEKYPKLGTRMVSFSKVVGDQSTKDAGYEVGKSLNLNRELESK